jgi:type IV pilus assembly protein PilO
MTVSGDFIPEENGVQEAPEYPTAFGIPLSPVVIGVIVGVLGLAAALFLVVRLLQPALQERSQLAAELRGKQADLANQEQALQEVEAVEAALDEALAQRRNIYGLFATSEQLDTLLIDLNRQVLPTNTGITDLRQQLISAGFDPGLVGASLTQVEPVPDESGVITEEAGYGTEVVGKLQRERINVALQGDFAQIQSIVRNVERLEPLLILQDFELEISDEDEEASELIGTQILDAQFTIDALLPTSSPEELPEVEAPAEGEEAEGEQPAQ